MQSAATAHATVEARRLTELELKNDRLELTLLPELGCHWTRLRASAKGAWLDLLVPATDHEALLRRPTGSGSYVLAPWSNRIAGAAFELEGRRHVLRPSFPDGTAIHGDVRARAWKVILATAEAFEAALDSRELSDFNYPFALRFRHRLDLEGERLRVELSIENADRERAPVGFGFHPFLKRRLTAADADAILVVPASKVYPAEGCIPTGPAEPVSGRTDLRHVRFLGAPGLDHCFTGLESEEIRAIYPGTRLEVRFRLDPAFTHVVVYAPNDADGRPRDFVAVEPVTNANDGFNAFARGWPGTGVKVLEPGERWGAAWELSVGDI
ncbi:MAG: hypothetical protein HY721_26035 [Planctomycetes bacterium]|nr:hypothetical protein [Planctomycetota bacterium]